MHSDSLICLRFEFVRSSWKRMLQQLRSASGNSRFLWKAWKEEVGGRDTQWLSLFKHPSAAKIIWKKSRRSSLGSQQTGGISRAVRKAELTGEIPSPDLACCSASAMTLHKVL